MDISQLTSNPLALACVAAGVVMLVMHYGGPVAAAVASQVPHAPVDQPPQAAVDAVIAAYRAAVAAGRQDVAEILGRALQCVLTHPAQSQGASNGPAK